MFDRRPEIHRQSTDLDLHADGLCSGKGLHRVRHDHMVTAVTARFHMIDIVLFRNDLHIGAVSYKFRHLLNILHKLADDADACDIIQLFFNLVNFNVFLLCFI